MNCNTRQQVIYEVAVVMVNQPVRKSGKKTRQKEKIVVIGENANIRHLNLTK